MRKVGWSLLIAVLVLLGGFIALLSWGGVQLNTPRPNGTAVAAPPAAAPTGGLLAVPVKGYPREAIQDSWGDPRENGKRQHHGTDILAPPGTAVVAVAPGRVEKLFQSARGGTTLYLRSADRRWTYYYAHLSGYAPGVREGQAVRTGNVLGFVGDTGDAGPGNYHLHFGMTRTTPDQHWYQGEDVNPYPALAGKAAAR